MATTETHGNGISRKTSLSETLWQLPRPHQKSQTFLRTPSIWQDISGSCTVFFQSTPEDNVFVPSMWLCLWQVALAAAQNPFATHLSEPDWWGWPSWWRGRTFCNFDCIRWAPTCTYKKFSSIKKCLTLRQSQADQRHPKATYDLYNGIEKYWNLGMPWCTASDAAPGTAVINSAQIIEGHLHREIAWDLGDCLLDLLAVLNDLGSWWLGPS